jgi:hypothetical protein
VIGPVAARAGTRVRQLVYLDAFVPRPGQSILGLVPAARREFFLTSAAEHGNGWQVPLDWDAALDGWLITDPAARSWMPPLRPRPLATLTDPYPHTATPAQPLRSYLHCQQGPMAATFAQFAAGARDEGWAVSTLNTGHDALVTTPAEVAAALLNAV